MAAPTLTPTGIRTDVVARLKAAATVAGSKVYDSRDLDYEVDEPPALSVSSIGGNDNKWGIGQRLTKHVERLAIVGMVKGTEEGAVAAARDVLEGEVYDALAQDTEWLQSFDSVESMESAKKIDTESEYVVGSVAIVLELHYSIKYTPVPAPVPFTEVAVTTEPTDPAGADVSERVIELDQ